MARRYLFALALYGALLGCGSSKEPADEPAENNDRAYDSVTAANPEIGASSPYQEPNTAARIPTENTYPGNQNSPNQLALQPFYNFGQTQQNSTVPLVGGLFSFFANLFGFGGNSYSNYGSQGYYGNGYQRPPSYYPGSGYQGSYQDPLRLVEFFPSSSCGGFPGAQLNFTVGQSRFNPQACEQYRYANLVVGSVRINGGYCESLVRQDTLGNIGNGLQYNPSFYANSGWNLYQVCTRLFQ